MFKDWMYPLVLLPAPRSSGPGPDPNNRAAVCWKIHTFFIFQKTHVNSQGSYLYQDICCIGVENTGIRFHNLFSLHVYLILSMIIINFPHGNLWIFRIKSVLNQCSLVTSIFERWGKFWDENEAQPLARVWLQVAYYHTTLCPCPAISLLSDPGSFQRHWKHQSSNKGWKHPQHVIASIAWVDIMSKQALA